MNWYLSKIIFQIVCGDGKHTPQFDEQLRLIKAADEEEAFRKAVSIGTSEQETFYNQKQQLVQWRFINVSELHQMSLIDEAEIHSRISEVDCAEDYIGFIHKKAERIQNNHADRLMHIL